MIGKTVTRLFGAAVGLAMMTTAAAAAQYEWTFQTSETAGEPTFKYKQEWAQNIGSYNFV